MNDCTIIHCLYLLMVLIRVLLHHVSLGWVWWMCNGPYRWFTRRSAVGLSDRPSGVRSA